MTAPLPRANKQRAAPHVLWAAKNLARLRTPEQGAAQWFQPTRSQVSPAQTNALQLDTAISNIPCRSCCRTGMSELHLSARVVYGPRKAMRPPSSTHETQNGTPIPGDHSQHSRVVKNPDNHHTICPANPTNTIKEATNPLCYEQDRSSGGHTSGS